MHFYEAVLKDFPMLRKSIYSLKSTSYDLHTFNFLCLSLKNNTQNKKLKSIILKSMFIFKNPKRIALFLRQGAKIHAKDLWKLK